MKNKRILTIAGIITLVLLSAITAVRQSPIVKAQDQSPSAITSRISFGTIGFTSGQTIRVSVANSIMPRDVNLPPGPTRVVLTFRYTDGSLVRDYRTSEIIRKVIDLERGDSAFLDIDYDRLPPSPIRVQLRPVITVQPPSITEAGQIAIPYESIVPSIEAINNANGRTQFATFTHPAVARGFNPQPDPPKEE